LIWSQPAVRIAAALAAPLLMMMLVGATLERRWPAAARRRDKGAVNLAAWGALTFCEGATGPALGGVATLAVNAAGGGLIVLPAHGWGLALSLAAYFVAMDLGEYLFHRAQHAIPWLWAMHSLHHSDPDFDATTAARHFWLEPAIKAVTIWLAVAVLFKTPPGVVGVWIAFSYWHYVVHSNCRLDFGRWSWALNGPAYHRLHHSRLAEHFDVNFAALFPIFDLALGSYRRPRPGEAVPTGLDTGEAPQTPWQAMTWPLRGRGAAPALAAPAPAALATQGDPL
jgi:sterol desaturase/sphingolipid hydroxylase (fatty acid hydroxylase superfamily)